MPARHYLDHAATTWPKPPSVLEAMVHYQSDCGAPASRGVYKSGLESNNLVQETRRSLRALFNASSTEEIAFCSNGTHALNAAIFGLALGTTSQPLHVLTTSIEHNSVLRPLELAASRNWLQWSSVGCDSQGMIDPSDLESAIRNDTRLLIVSHVSNVTGAVQDLKAISAIARSRGILLMVDASQSAGYLPIDLHELGIDILATAGHKGLCGMLGTGVLIIKSVVQGLCAPFLIGGTGESSDKINGEFSWQATVESGNLNVPAIASLNAGLKWKKQSAEPPYELWNQTILDTIHSCENLALVGSPIASLEQRLPVFSLVAKSSSSLFQTPQEMAVFLDSAGGVECRAGFHCAGMIHDSLGTRQLGGTLRLSLGCTSTQADVDAACTALRSLDEMMVV
ncbi:aminotransferase class V-fold PLP-dependent enzyme [Pirellulaceae bacterium SH449]